MTARWLFKTEPGDYSYQDLLRDGRTVWDGVGNNWALQHLRSVARGDGVLIYHTGRERAVVGTATVARGPYPDPERGDPRYVVVDLRAGRPLERPVPLARIKKETALRDWELVRFSRLSVMPVTRGQWEAVLRLAG